MPLRGTSFRGFPFEEEEGSGAWSELAARHPDIAARLRQRPAAWARKRRPDSQGPADDFEDDFAGFNRGFPFDDIPPEFREHFPTHWNRRHGSREEQPPPQSPPQQQQHSPRQQTAATQTEDKPGPSEQSQIPQYGLRNTVDLGQKSPLDPSVVDAEERLQRSMSAPPPQPAAAMSHSEPEPQPAGNVRHIPIFVEGRDEPVLNRSVDAGPHFADPKPQFAPPPPPHAERDQYFDDGPSFHPPSNFSRAFGTPFNKGYRQGPQPFVQQKVYPQSAFARGASPQRAQSPRPPPDEHFVKVPVHHEPAPRAATPPRAQPAHPPAQPPHPPAQPPHPPTQPPHPPAPHQPSPPPPPPPKPSNDPITQILSIQTDVLNLMTDVENFTGTKKDKRYIYLDEMLTRNLIKLDNIETEGKENIRLARKEAIKCIEKCIAVLEAKAEKGNAEAQAQDVEMNEGPTDNGESVAPSNEEEMKEAKDATQEVDNKPEGDVSAQVAEQPQVEAEQPADSQPPQPDTRPGADAPTKPDQAPPECKPLDENTKPQDTKVTENKPNPKKGPKSAKKRDKSKDKVEKSDQKTEPTTQVENKGDSKPEQPMEIDSATSQ